MIEIAAVLLIVIGLVCEVVAISCLVLFLNRWRQ